MRRSRSALCFARSPLMRRYWHETGIDSILELVQFSWNELKRQGEHSMTDKSILKRLSASAGLATAIAMLVCRPALAQDLNALIWCDHADPALLEPFEKANNVKVNVKEFEGTGAGLAIIDQSQPGDWDVM